MVFERFGGPILSVAVGVLRGDPTLLGISPRGE